MSFFKKEDFKSSLKLIGIGLGIGTIIGISEAQSINQKLQISQIEDHVFQNSVARGEQPHLCDEPTTIKAIKAARKYKDHVTKILPVLLEGDIKLPKEIEAELEISDSKITKKEFEFTSRGDRYNITGGLYSQEELKHGNSNTITRIIGKQINNKVINGDFPISAEMKVNCTSASKN